MAAAARESNERPYKDGGGYGKFRKRPFRRSAQTTPYDRPATAIRNPSGSSNGWLSKLVDPAQRLIASGAHRLFASVFRKRLPAHPLVPAPSQPPETEASQGAMDKQKGTFSTDLHGTHGAAVNGCSGPSNSSDTDGVTELEVILKQKTFTRSEIDRLTALLQSKTVDFPAENKEKKSEAIPSRAVVSQGKKELLNTPVNNGFEGHFKSTPIVGSSVLEEDVGSPTELAKAYMRSRPLKASPSMLESHSQSLRGNSTALTSHTFTPKSPMISIAPRSSGHAGFPENGFVTPRSRGRSAIYSMARTPYSRVHATTGLQGTGTVSDAFAGLSSSSQNAWENNRFSGSKQGALKRRSSVMDNDMGSVGPIRRIRQKSNLLPLSGTLSIRGNGIGSNAAQRLSSTEKPVLVGELLKDNVNTNVHGTGFTPVPSKSSEMASKILEQLDVLVSSREKSPAKLSPSMLRGPALRSLENVDSSKLLEIISDNNKLDAKNDTLLADARESVFKMKDKIEENGPSKSILPYEKSALAVNGMDSTSSMKNDVAGVKKTAFSAMSTASQSLQQKKRAFQMSAHEDFLELDDDDDYPSGTAPGLLAAGREKVDTNFIEKKTIGAEAIVVEKSPACSEVNSQSTSTLNQNNAGIDGSVVAEKSTGFTSPVVLLPSMTDKQAVVNKLPSISDEAALPKDSNASRIFSSEEKVALPKELNGTSQAFHFINKTGDKVVPFSFSSPVLRDPSGPKLGLSSDAKPEGFSFTPVATGAPELANRDPGSDKTDGRSSLKPGGSFRAPENGPSTSSSTPTGSLFSFGITTNSSSLNNGSLASTPSSNSSPSPPLLSCNFTGQNSSSISANNVGSSNATATAFATANSNGNSNLSISAPAPSSVATPIFNFGSVPSTSASTVPATADETTEAKTKEPSSGNPTSAPLVGISSAITSSAGSIFGVTCSGITNAGSNIFGETPAVTSKEKGVFGGAFPAVTSTGSSILNSTSSAVASTESCPFSFNAGSTTSAATNQSQGFNPFSAASAQVSASGTGLATSTQSMLMQFSSPASTPFASTGSLAFSSGSSTFGSSSTSKLFSSGASFGLTSSTSSSDSISASSIASPASTLFGSNWQAPKSSGFSSSSSSSTLFAFGATSSAVTSSSASVGFAPSVSSGPPFPFSSPASATPSQSVFGNPNPGFRFGSSPSGNNDQMSMEDSMAEDTVQATTPSVPVFFQQTATPGSIFGFSTPPGGNQFASTGSSSANPFQFESQPNLAAPQNSAFQASGSLEFNAGGSFSLGAGGSDKSGRKIVKVKRQQRKR